MTDARDRPSALLQFFRFFISFQFLALVALVLFCCSLYFLIYSLRSQPDAFREAVWEDQFNKANFDTEFVTPVDHYEVDLSLWMPVKNTLRGTPVSAVRQIVRRQVIRKPEQNEYLMAMHTSGLKPDFSCLTHPFSFTKDYGLDKPVGAENLSRFTAKIDISKEPVDAPINLEFIVYSWNAFQGIDNQMFGAYARPGTQRLSFHFVMPDSLKNFSIDFQRFDAEANAMVSLRPEQMNYRSVDKKKFDIEIKNPRSGDGYFIRWRVLRDLS